MTTDIRALGIDVGSTTVKIVGVDAAGNLAWSFFEPAEPRVQDQVGKIVTKENICARRQNDSKYG